MSDALDAEDYIADAYILEVSSPGLGRTLKKDRHLEKSLGEEVEIKTYKPIDGHKEFVGILKAYDKDTITIAESENEKNETVSTDMDRILRRQEIALVRLTLDF